MPEWYKSTIRLNPQTWRHFFQRKQGVQAIFKTLCKHHIMCVMRKNYLPQTVRGVNRLLRGNFGEVMCKSVSEIDHIFAPISDQNES